MSVICQADLTEVLFSLLHFSLWFYFVWKLSSSCAARQPRVNMSLKRHLQTQVTGWFCLCFCRDFISLKSKTGRRVNAQQWPRSPERPACRYWMARRQTELWGVRIGIGGLSRLPHDLRAPSNWFCLFVLFIYYVLCLLFQYELILHRIPFCFTLWALTRALTFCQDFPPLSLGCSDKTHTTCHVWDCLPDPRSNHFTLYSVTLPNLYFYWTIPQTMAQGY